MATFACRRCDLVGGKTELADCRARGTDNRRLGETTGGDACGQSFVETEHLGQHNHGQKPTDGEDGGHDNFADRLAPEGTEELRATLEADGINEQSEKNRLDAIVDGDANLAEHDCDQKRACDTTELELAELEFSDPVATRQ
jgi:hypothetical protein